MKTSPLLQSAVCLLLFTLVSLTTACRASESAPPALAGKRVLWLGDSITAAGGYVSDVEYRLNRAFPTQVIDLVSVGLSSETVSGLSEKRHPFPRPCLHERLQRALDAVKPAVVVACYGMNDGIYHPQSPERMKAFQDGINKLIAAAKTAQAEVVLLTPPPFDPVPVKSVQKAGAGDYAYTAPFENYDSVLGDYANWELSLHIPGVFVVDLHTVLNDYLKSQRVANPQFRFGGDGIHPNAAGHLLMARTITEALGLPVDKTELDAELNRRGADPLFKLVDAHRQMRSGAWLAYIGYTRGGKVKSPSVEAAEKRAADLQKQIDSLRK